jgi:CubicO group peptidase (beta-lactamase class C family)
MLASRVLSRFTVLALSAACALGAGPARAADLALQDSVSMAGMQLYLNAGAPGLIIVVVRGEDVVIQGYGETAPGNGVEPDAQSIFRLGSVSKVFATDVLAALAAKDKVRLTDPLAKAGGADYSAVLAEEVLKPAGLADTANTLTDAQKQRLMTGLDPFGKPDPNAVVPDVMYASAGLYSTADDMARWMRWHLDGARQAKEAFALDHALWLPYDGLKSVVGTEVTDADGMGLGWVVSLPRNGAPLLRGKSGGLGGFMTYAVLSPNRGLGVFVVASRVNFAMFENIHSQVRELAAELAR